MQLALRRGASDSGSQQQQRQQQTAIHQPSVPTSNVPVCAFRAAGLPRGVLQICSLLTACTAMGTAAILTGTIVLGWLCPEARCFAVTFATRKSRALHVVCLRQVSQVGRTMHTSMAVQP